MNPMFTGRPSTAHINTIPNVGFNNANSTYVLYFDFLSYFSLWSPDKYQKMLDWGQNLNNLSKLDTINF